MHAAFDVLGGCSGHELVVGFNKYVSPWQRFQRLLFALVVNARLLLSAVVGIGLKKKYISNQSDSWM